jgi:YgiT-type zinc finger domain-containing protein
MRCRICGGLLEPCVTDLPFKIGDSAIVILRPLPVLQCCQCGDSELEQATMARIDQLLAAVEGPPELAGSGTLADRIRPTADYSPSIRIPPERES